MKNSLLDTCDARNESSGFDRRLLAAEGVVIRFIADLKTHPALVAKDLYLEGAYVLQCSAGRFRVTLDGTQMVELGNGEMLVTYPGHRMTLEALERVNQLCYISLCGHSVEDYLDSLGFFHGQHGRAALQPELLKKIRDLLAQQAADPVQRNRTCLSMLNDILFSAAMDLQNGTNVVLCDAIRQLHANLRKGIVRLEPLCKQLRVSRAHLHAIFVQSGLPPPSAFIRNEQKQLILRLLRMTQLPITEIARRAGFTSMTHFANFMRRETGKSARAWRMESRSPADVTTDELRSE